MNIKREVFCIQQDDVLFYVGIVICIVLFGVTLIRSIITGITYDEAYTYLYAAKWDLFSASTLKYLFMSDGCIANNHWLNTFLIFFVEKLVNEPFNEFLIRLPSLFFFALYLFIACAGYKKKYYTFTTLLFLIGNNYVNELYGLASGYGMANTCVFGMCLSYSAWKRSKFEKIRYFSTLMILAVFACFSNTIVLLLYPAFGGMCLYHIIKEKLFRRVIERSSFLILVFAVCTAIQVIYHLNISRDGKPLFTGGKRNFFECIIKGNVDMFVKDPFSCFVAVIVVVLGIGSLIVLRKKSVGT